MSDTQYKASAGQPFRPPDAELWNAMVDAGAAYRDQRLSVNGGGLLPRRQTDVIKVKNESGQPRARGEILGDFSKLLSEVNSEHLWLRGKKAVADKPWGFLLKPLDVDEVGEIQVSGVGVAKLELLSDTHQFAELKTDSYLLRSAASGPVEIVYRPTVPSGTLALCIVVFRGGTSTTFYAATMKEAWSGRQALCDIKSIDGVTVTDTGEDAIVYDPLGTFADLTTGDTMEIKSVGGKYYTNQAPCPA